MDYGHLVKDYLDDANEHLSVFDDALLSLEKDGFNKNIIMYWARSIRLRAIQA